MIDVNNIKQGMKIRTNTLVDRRDSTMGMLISEKHLNVRKSGITGTVQGYVAGHGGDVWWVKHDETGDVAAYVFTEMDTI